MCRGLRTSLNHTVISPRTAHAWPMGPSSSFGSEMSRRSSTERRRPAAILVCTILCHTYIPTICSCKTKPFSVHPLPMPP